MFVWIAVQIFLLILSISTPRDGLNTFAFVIYIIFYCGSIIPSVAISVRRHHDAGWSGWWYLISIWSFILMFFPSKTVGNKYRAETSILLVPEVQLKPATTPITNSFESEQNEIDFQPSEKDMLVSKKKILIIISSLLSALLVISLIINSNYQKITPNSIASAMRQWCDNGTIVTSIGVQAVQVFASGEHATGVTDALACYQGAVKLEVFFFQTAYDENQYLSYFSNGMIWSGSSAEQFVNPVSLSVDKGFVADFGWPKKNPSTTQGLMRQWMKDTFGVFPSTTIIANQQWKGTLPPITYKTFGEKGPGSGPAVIN
jgi:uncharacterized membrane protein YhaH (DUF805 family)